MEILGNSFQPVIVMMKLSGVLPIEKWPRLQQVLFMITFGLMLSFNKDCIVGNLNQGEMRSALITFSVTGTVLLSTFRYLVVRIRIGKIQKLFKDLDAISFDKEQEVEHNFLQIVKKVKFLVKVSTVLFGSGMGSFVFHAVLIGRRMLPLDVFFQVDYSKDFDRWIFLYIWQTLDFYAMWLATSISEIIPATILIILCGHLRSLGYQLTNLPTYPVGAFNEALKLWFMEYQKIKR